MARISIEQAVSMARRQYLAVPGIVAVSRIGNTIVFYVERPEDAAKVPRTYAGYPVAVKVTGPVVTLR